MTAEWRPIPGHDGYEASNLGQVRSLRRGTPHVLAPHLAGPRREYLYVNLGSIHALVAAAFLGPRPEGQVTRHLNGDSKDNRPENLAYGTQSDNMRDALAHGTNFEKNKTHCKRGHEFTTENTLQRISHRTGLPARGCKTCVNVQQRAWMKQYRLRKKEVAA